MGVYIDGMEMPKEGRLTLQISADGAVYIVNSCSITAETYTTDAVPVPPHGRLGDLDQLKELFREVIGNIAKRKEIEPVLEHMVRASAMVIEMIDDAPTVIEAEDSK